MADLTIKNIPDFLHERLKVIAAENRHSVSDEIIRIIERAVADYNPKKSDNFDKIIRLRKKSAHYFLTEEELNKWKDEGRP